MTLFHKVLRESGKRHSFSTLTPGRNNFFLKICQPEVGPTQWAILHVYFKKDGMKFEEFDFPEEMWYGTA